MTAPWRDAAACRGHNLTLWFPPRGGTNDTAVRICRTCDVTIDCLNDALAQVSLDDKGVRGGLSEKARRQIRNGTRTVAEATR